MLKKIDVSRLSTVCSSVIKDFCSKKKIQSRKDMECFLNLVGFGLTSSSWLLSLLLELSNSSLALISFKISVGVFVQSIKSVLPFQCFGRGLAGNQIEVQLVLASYGIQLNSLPVVAVLDRLPMLL